jgi:hypothetical protein
MNQVFCRERFDERRFLGVGVAIPQRRCGSCIINRTPPSDDPTMESIVTSLSGKKYICSPATNKLCQRLLLHNKIIQSNVIYAFSVLEFKEVSMALTANSKKHPPIRFGSPRTTDTTTTCPGLKGCALERNRRRGGAAIDPRTSLFRRKELQTPSYKPSID